MLIDMREEVREINVWVNKEVGKIEGSDSFLQVKCPDIFNNIT